MCIEKLQGVVLEHEAGGVHVWLVHPEVLAAEMAEPGLQGLQAFEAARALALPSLDQKQAYIARHKVLRRLLAAYTGCPAGALQLQLQAGGKPLLAPGHPGPHFSMSSTQGWLLAAFCWDQVVGVDIESLRGDAGVQAIAERHFSPAERFALRDEQDPQRLQRFFQMWTRKEAVLKMHGLGVDHLDRLREPGSPLNRAWIEDLHLPLGLAGTVVLPRAPMSLTLRSWAPRPVLVADPELAALAASAAAA